MRQRGQATAATVGSGSLWKPARRLARRPGPQDHPVAHHPAVWTARKHASARYRKGFNKHFCERLRELHTRHPKNRAATRHAQAARVTGGVRSVRSGNPRRRPHARGGRALAAGKVRRGRTRPLHKDLLLRTAQDEAGLHRAGAAMSTVSTALLGNAHIPQRGLGGRRSLQHIEHMEHTHPQCRADCKSCSFCGSVGSPAQPAHPGRVPGTRNLSRGTRRAKERRGSACCAEGLALKDS